MHSFIVHMPEYTYQYYVAVTQVLQRHRWLIAILTVHCHFLWHCLPETYTAKDCTACSMEYYQYECIDKIHCYLLIGCGSCWLVHLMTFHCCLTFNHCTSVDVVLNWLPHCKFCTLVPYPWHKNDLMPNFKAVHAGIAATVVCIPARHTMLVAVSSNHWSLINLLLINWNCFMVIMSNVWICVVELELTVEILGSLIIC